MSVAQKMLSSITSSDFYIVVAAIVALMLLVLSVIFAVNVEKRIKQWRQVRNKDFSHYMYRGLSLVYTLFVTSITIFPLLGMFGTVIALLGVDMTGDMGNLQNRFFDALTSTAWGIVFAIFFKVLNALFATYVEEQIEEAKNLSVEMLLSREAEE